MGFVCPVCGKNYKKRKMYVNHLKSEGFTLKEIVELMGNNTEVEESKPNKPKVVKKQKVYEEECPECGEILKIKEGQEKIKCPACGEVFEIEW